MAVEDLKRKGAGGPNAREVPFTIPDGIPFHVGAQGCECVLAHRMNAARGKYNAFSKTIP
jgi:hypothetical protein